MTRVHKTGHFIADTVADAFIVGNYEGDADLVYGILRHNFFTSSKNWFEVDRGYFNPGHFDGYYRISYKGTQAKWHEGIPQADIDFELEDWRDKSGYVLVCPPSDYVKQFFDIGWEIDKQLMQCWEIVAGLHPYRVRRKDDASYIEWNKIRGVITFNSSIGWQALQRGIPCISDTEHSIVGSYYKHELDKLGLEYNFENVKLIPREPLFQAMKAHQFTLNEIRKGKAWNLIQYYISKQD